MKRHITQLFLTLLTGIVLPSCNTTFANNISYEVGVGIAIIIVILAPIATITGVELIKYVIEENKRK